MSMMGTRKGFLRSTYDRRIYFLLLALHFVLSQASAANPCAILERLANRSVKAQWEPTTKKIDDWLSLGVSRATQSTTDREIFPDSIRPVSAGELVRNQIFFNIFEGLRAVTGWFGNSSGEIGFLKTIDKTQKVLKALRLNRLLKGSIWGRIETMLEHPVLRDEKGDVSLGVFVDFHRQYLKDIDADKTEYGAEFFDKEAIAQGAINSFAMKLFSNLNGQDVVWDRLSVNAISLLHPLVDAAMDKGHMSDATMKKLALFLTSGTEPPIETKYERLLFGYLARFEKSFPRDKVPGFWLSLNRLFEAQIKSLKQKKAGTFDPDEYYRISLDKGGLSTVLAAYTALGPLTETQYEFFYRSGGVFQIIDDLLDIKKDQAEGVRTIWTEARKNGQSFAGPMKQLLNLEKMIEEELPRVAGDFSDPSAFQGVYSFSFKLSLFRALGRIQDTKDPELQKLFSGRHSLSLSAIQKLMTAKKSGRAKAREGSDLWLIEQLLEMTDTY